MTPTGGPVHRGDHARYHALPGGDTIRVGLEDLASGRETVAALLVSVGAPRLARLGITVPRPITQPEHRLYAVLHSAGPDSAHSRYNGLIRRLTSFERALACGS